MFEKGNILTLADDNEYSVVDQFNDNGINYVYLVDINNTSNIIYGKLENDEIIEISDAEELEKVIKIVYNNTHGNKEQFLFCLLKNIVIDSNVNRLYAKEL